MSSYKNENENNVQINPKILSLVYTIHLSAEDAYAVMSHWSLHISVRQ